MRCERCGKRTYDFSLFQVSYPKVMSLNVKRGTTHQDTTVNLCPECNSALIEWLDIYEEKKDG